MHFEQLDSRDPEPYATGIIVGADTPGRKQYSASGSNDQRDASRLTKLAKAILSGLNEKVARVYLDNTTTQVSE